jgi:hypothetical protein
MSRIPRSAPSQTVAAALAVRPTGVCPLVPAAKTTVTPWMPLGDVENRSVIA